jgi:predicted ArsR family transcriptional regulator
MSPVVAFATGDSTNAGLREWSGQGEVQMQPTRWQIVEILKLRGRATVDELSKELGITLMAVRLHLVVLERDGLVSRGSIREGPGRPTLLYRLTEQAEDAFPKRYDQLANSLLAAAKAELGAEGVEALMRHAAHSQAAGLLGQIGTGGLADRVADLVRAESREDALCRREEAEDGYFVHRYSCPYYRVAKQHPEVCALHRRTLSEALAAEVEPVSLLVQGEGRCSFLIREPAPVRAEGSSVESVVLRV